jgi:hypothetical protein
MDDFGDQQVKPDVFEVADFLIARAIETYGDEIDIIGYYGSHAQGLARETSDLDIFYIPADGKSPPVGRTFLIAGMLYDFWGIRWDWMEGFATGKIRGWAFAPALVYHTQVLWARSNEQAARFEALKQQVRDLQAPEARHQMIHRALDEFQCLLAHLGNLRLAVVTDDFSDVRYAGWKVIASGCECLALVNQTFFDRGLDKILGQLPRLAVRPEGLEGLIIVIGTSDDPGQILEASEQLVLETRQILRDAQGSLTSDRTPQAQFDGAYPEFKDGIRKVIEACERQQPAAASSAAWSIQNELSLMLHGLQSSADHSKFNLYHEFAALYRQEGFPDLLRVPTDDLSALGERTRLLDERLRRWLGDQEVSLNEFETIEDFKRSGYP